MHNTPGLWPTESDAAVSEILRHIGTRLPGAAVLRLASYPVCLNTFVASLRNCLDSCRFAQAASVVRKSADESSSLITFSDHLAWMKSAGFDREAIRQIRYVVEVFYHLEPCDAVIAASATAWLNGAVDAQPREELPECELTVPALDGKIDLADEARLPSSVLPFADRFGAPLHAFYRALAVWPEYAGLAWSEFATVAASDAFTDAASKTADCAREACRGLLSEPCHAHLQSECSHLIPALHACLTASSQVALITAALRRTFIEAEKAQSS